MTRLLLLLAAIVFFTYGCIHEYSVDHVPVSILAGIIAFIFAAALFTTLFPDKTK